MSSLFEVYDSYTFFWGLSLNWFCLMFLSGFMFSSYWMLQGGLSLFWCLLMELGFIEFKVFFNTKVLKCFVFSFLVLLFYLVLLNLLGLIPYVFSCSAHLSFCLSFSFPFWVGLMLLGWVLTANKMFCHLIPVGTPVFLISFMVMIETVSQLIRPWSLSIRLMANMISGHLLMSLLGGCSSYFYFFQLCLFMFEFFVCFIQGYVFCALLTLYYGEI